MSDFTSISETYERTSLVQKSASEVLIELLEIQEGSMILDLGCGTGHIAKLLRDETNSTVIGVDPAAGMIEKAKETITDTNISFLNLTADQLDIQNSFDVIFCNSAFQWFKNPGPSLNACYKALKHGGRIGIQAPAKNQYCPNFMDAVDRVAEDDSIRDIFKKIVYNAFERQADDKGNIDLVFYRIYLIAEKG